MERVDQIIKQLEELHKQAHEIFDARVEVILSTMPYGTSLGATKAHYIFTPAGSTLNYVKALQNLRDGKTAKWDGKPGK